MDLISLIPEDGVTTVQLESPILARRLLTEISAVLKPLANAPSPQPLVLASAHPTIFLAGAHLGEIAELDERSCAAYAEFGRGVASLIESHPAPVVASVHGSCSGGGFDLVLACDAIVASPRATFSHPGVHRGLVTGWGGTTRLDLAVGSSVTRRALLEGTPIDSAAGKELGMVLEVTDESHDRACATAREMALLHPSRLAEWRLLRGSSFVDRFRAFVVEKS